MSWGKFIKIALILLVVALLVALYYVYNRKDEFKIGAILPLTGQSAAQYGEWIRDALEMAVDEVNQGEGGINGKKLVIVYEDDQATPQAAANAMQKLAGERLPIVFGSWASSCVLAQAPIAERTKTPILAEAQSPQIRDAGDYVFRIQPDSRYYLKYLVPHAYNQMAVRTLAILYVNNDFGRDQSTVFSEAFRSLGGTVLLNEAFEQGATDFRTQLTKLKAANPDAVFIPAYMEAGYILKQAAELGFSPKFIGSAPLENPDILRIAGQGANGAIYPHHFDPESSDPRVQQFLREYRRRTGRDAEGYAALAYDGLHVIASVLRTCGDNRECIKNSLYQVRDFPGITGPTTFDSMGDVIKPIVIRAVRDGKFVTISRPSATVR